MGPGLPRFLFFGLLIHGGSGRARSSASVYYTERRPKNKKQGRPGNEATGAHDVIAITSLQKNDLCTEELRDIDRAKATLELTLWHKNFTIRGCSTLE